MRRIAGCALAVAALAAVVFTADAAGRTDTPRCFGAAAHDPAHPCVNPALDHTVVPTPDEAVLVPGSPCAIVAVTRSPEVCAFGSPRARAVRTFALVGDSHAEHWRAALDPIGRRRNWHGLSVTHSRCPFTAATQLQPEPDRGECVRWNRATLAWLGRHREISLVVVSAHRNVPVVAVGQDQQHAQMAGFAAAWAALPPSVLEIVVVRDVPYEAGDTHPCVTRSIARRRDAGRACAVPREFALRPDAEALAVELLRPPRARVVDLSDFFCDARRCPPVIGGVLVHKDFGHLTRLFAQTLAPYLDADLGELP